MNRAANTSTQVSVAIWYANMALRSDRQDMPCPFRYDQITPTSGRRNAIDTRNTLPYTRLAPMPTPMKPEMAGCSGSLRTTRTTAIRAALASEPQIATVRLNTVLSRTNTSTGTDE